MNKNGHNQPAHLITGTCFDEIWSYQNICKYVANRWNTINMRFYLLSWLSRNGRREDTNEPSLYFFQIFKCSKKICSCAVRQLFCVIKRHWFILVCIIWNKQHAEPHIYCLVIFGQQLWELRAETSQFKNVYILIYKCTIWPHIPLTMWLFVLFGVCLQ